MLKSFIDANVGKDVVLFATECDLDGQCMAGEGDDRHYVKGLFLGLRYYKRFRCLGIQTSPKQVVLVRLKNVIRVEPLANTHGEDSDGRGRTEGTDPGAV